MIQGDVHWKKILLIPVVFTVLSCAGLYYLYVEGYGNTFFHEPVFQETISLERIEKFSEGVQDRLYKVTSQGVQRSFLVATDGVIEDGVGYDVEEIQKNPFWNPVSCSKMPFVKVGHLLYFLELVGIPEGDTIKKVSRLYVFDYEDKKLMQYNLELHTIELNIVGFLYNDEEGVYIVTASLQNRVPFVAVYGFDVRNERLQLRDVFDMSVYAFKSPLFLKSNNDFGVSFFDKELSTKELIYKNGHLEEEALVKNESIYFAGNAYKVFDTHDATYLTKQDLADFSHVQIVAKDTSEVIADLLGNGIHKYVLTEI